MEYLKSKSIVLLLTLMWRTKQNQLSFHMIDILKSDCFPVLQESNFIGCYNKTVSFCPMNAEAYTTQEQVASRNDTFSLRIVCLQAGRYFNANFATENEATYL